MKKLDRATRKQIVQDAKTGNLEKRIENLEKLAGVRE